MPDFPIADSQRHEAVYTAAASLGISVTSGAANTKGAAWTELIASTAFDATLLIVEVVHTGSLTDLDFLVDLAIGGAGSEQILVANLIGSVTVSASGYNRYAFPIQVPAGTRISAKVQASTTTLPVRILLGLHSQGMIASCPLSVVDTIGANTADSGGTSIDPGGVANTLAWTQMTASTSRDARGFILSLTGQLNAARVNTGWIIHVGIGAAASEQKIGTFVVFADSSSQVLSTTSPFIPCSVPAGSRVAVGAQCSIIDATDRLFDATLYMVA